VVSEKGGVIRLKNPFENSDFIIEGHDYSLEDDVIVISTKKGSAFKLMPKY